MSSTKFVFFGPIGKTKWPPWPIRQKGGTLYSGARYVALWASCLDVCFIMVLIQSKTIMIERGVWGSSPRKSLIELVQNPAIIDNLEGTLAWFLCHNKSKDCHKLTLSTLWF